MRINDFHRLPEKTFISSAIDKKRFFSAGNSFDFSLIIQYVIRLFNDCTKQFLCLNANRRLPSATREKNSSQVLLIKIDFFQQGFHLISIGLRAWSFAFREYNNLFTLLDYVSQI